MELLIPELKKSISYQLLLILLERPNHEQSLQNSLSTWCILPKAWTDFQKLKETFHVGTSFLEQRNYRELFYMGGLMIRSCQGGEGLVRDKFKMLNDKHICQ